MDTLNRSGRYSDLLLFAGALLALFLFYLKQFHAGACALLIFSVLSVLVSRWDPSVLLANAVATTLIIPSGGYFYEGRMLNVFVLRLTVDKILLIALLITLLLKIFSRKKPEAFRINKNSMLPVLFCFIALLSFAVSPYHEDKFRILLLVLNAGLFILWLQSDIRPNLRSLLLPVFCVYFLSLLPALHEVFTRQNIFAHSVRRYVESLGLIHVLRGTEGFHLYLAVRMLVFLPLTYLFFKNRRVLVVFLIALQSFLILHTFSRGALLALGAELLLIGLLDLRENGLPDKKRIAAFLAALCFMVGGFYYSNFFKSFSLRNDIRLPVFLENFYFQKLDYKNTVVDLDPSHFIKNNPANLSTLVKMEKGDGHKYKVSSEISFVSRKIAVRFMREVLLERPFLGVGFGQFQIAASYSKTKEIVEWLAVRKADLAPDNLYVQILAESGICGGIVFFLAAFAPFLLVRKTRPELLIALAGVLIAGLSCEVLSNSHSSLLFWFLLLLIYVTPPAQACERQDGRPAARN